MKKDNPSYYWARYDNVGSVIEIDATYDDCLKKDDAFTSYAVRLANEILENHKLKIVATWGKWGARIEPLKNRRFGKRQLENAGNIIINDDSFKALKLSTQIFTYGLSDGDKEK